MPQPNAAGLIRIKVLSARQVGHTDNEVWIDWGREVSGFANIMLGCEREARAAVIAVTPTPPPSPPPTPTALPTATATPVPTPTVTPTPSPAVTPTPTALPTATATPVPTPTVTPTPSPAVTPTPTPIPRAYTGGFSRNGNLPGDIFLPPRAMAWDGERLLISRGFVYSQLWALDDPTDPSSATYIGELPGIAEAMTWNGTRLLYVTSDVVKGQDFLVSIPYPIETTTTQDGKVIVVENHGVLAKHYSNDYTLGVTGMTWDGARLLYVGTGARFGTPERVLWALDDYTKPETARMVGRFPDRIGGTIAVIHGDALTWDGTQLLLYDERGGKLFSFLQPQDVEFLMRDGVRDGTSLAWTGTHLVIGTYQASALYVMEPEQ